MLRHRFVVPDSQSRLLNYPYEETDVRIMNQLAVSAEGSHASFRRRLIVTAAEIDHACTSGQVWQLWVQASGEFLLGASPIPGFWVPYGECCLKLHVTSMGRQHEDFLPVPPYAPLPFPALQLEMLSSDPIRCLACFPTEQQLARLRCAYDSWKTKDCALSSRAQGH